MNAIGFKYSQSKKSRNPIGGGVYRKPCHRRTTMRRSRIATTATTNAHMRRCQ